MFDEIKALPDNVLSILEGFKVVCIMDVEWRQNLLMSLPAFPEPTYNFPRRREPVLDSLAKNGPCQEYWWVGWVVWSTSQVY
jgi:hypothetical protein